MASNKMDQEPKKTMVKICEGVALPTVFREDALRSAVNYEPKKGDIFVVSYPKCGTTWMQRIVLLIIRHGKVFDDPLDYLLGCPFIDKMGAEAVDHIIRPGAIKTHLPYEKVPKSKDAKYIYVCRNPKDCIVSYYYHAKNSPFKGCEDITFDEFFEHFIVGDVPYGDVFDHIMAWYEHRNEPNIYIVTYEALKKDIRGEVSKLAKFIGEEYENVLLNEPGVLDDVIKYSSFEYMKKGTNETIIKLMKGEAAPSEGQELSPFLIKSLEAFRKRNEGKPKLSVQLVRKGIVGDWKNHFNPDQLRRIEERIKEKTANSEVMSLWD